jgi:hypothetical protein
MGYFSIKGPMVSRHPPEFKYQMVERNGNQYVAYEIVVYRFQIPWEEDAVVVAGAPLYAWEQTEAGKWVKEHAVEIPRWERCTDHVTLNEQFAIIARLTEPDQTFFRLKFL